MHPGLHLLRRVLAAAWLATATVAGVPGCGHADPKADAQAAYRKGDFAAALTIWRPLAEAGDPAAQFDLGVLYDRGEGVAADMDKALWWYRRAAEHGDVKAQYNLGLFYEYGGPVTADPAEAVGWYRRAAEQGDAQAQYNLAFLIDNGLGAPADPAEAARWLQRAAGQGLAEAQNDLGGMYWRGRGVAVDRVEAYKWASLATARAPEGPAQDKAQHNRDLIARALSEAERAEGERRIQAWTPAAGPRCLVPVCGGLSLAECSHREELWAKYSTAAPRPRTPSERQYSDRRLRSKS